MTRDLEVSVAEEFLGLTVQEDRLVRPDDDLRSVFARALEKRRDGIEAEVIKPEKLIAVQSDREIDHAGLHESGPCVEMDDLQLGIEIGDFGTRQVDPILARGTDELDPVQLEGIRLVPADRVIEVDSNRVGSDSPVIRGEERDLVSTPIRQARQRPRSGVLGWFQRPVRLRISSADQSLLRRSQTLLECCLIDESRNLKIEPEIAQFGEILLDRLLQLHRERNFAWRQIDRFEVIEHRRLLERRDVEFIDREHGWNVTPRDGRIHLWHVRLGPSTEVLETGPGPEVGNDVHFIFDVAPQVHAFRSKGIEPWSQPRCEQQPA